MGNTHQPITSRVPSEGMPGALTLRVPSLRYWRGQRALRQDELAAKANVGVNSIYRGEVGQALRVDIVARLARALDVSPATLQRRPPEDQP